jgi:hypothetical protein
MGYPNFFACWWESRIWILEAQKHPDPEHCSIEHLIDIFYYGYYSFFI